MEDRKARLAQIATNLRSDKDQICFKAVSDLLQWCRHEPRIHTAALPLFQEAAGLTRFPYVANHAVGGIELISGSEPARQYRQAFLHDSDPVLVRATVLMTRDPSEVPALIGVLDQNQDPAVKESAVRLIGRLGTPAAFDVLIGALAAPWLRPHAVEALGDLRDVRAIPNLEALESDTTPAWPVDNHGPMLRVCDLAAEALRKIRSQPQVAATQPPLPQSVRGASAAATVGLAKHRFLGSKRLWSYVPVAALVFEIPWFVICILGLLFLMGDCSPQGVSPHQERVVSIFVSVPLVLGALGGLYALVFHRSPHTVDRVFLIIGMIVCFVIGVLTLT
jgi:hypothetical protein